MAAKVRVARALETAQPVRLQFVRPRCTGPSEMPTVWPLPGLSNELPGAAVRCNQGNIFVGVGGDLLRSFGFGMASIHRFYLTMVPIPSPSAP